MKSENKKNIAPVLTLIFLSPLIAEVLPGATRFSSLFVFPLEVLVWGGGALLIRYAVRKNGLCWQNMLLLALALSVAEEFLIQQTSAASLVIRLKGVTYARLWGINYVYLLWALVYESVFAVLLPVFLTELLFPNRRKEPWLNSGGVVLFGALFLVGCLGAWYTWTQIARIKVFHLPAYTPPPLLILTAVLTIAILVFISLKRPASESLSVTRKRDIPAQWMIFLSGVLWSVLLYGVSLLAFGIYPPFPPAIAVIACIVLAILPGYFLPRWKQHSAWNNRHVFSVIAGTMIGSMLVSFIGFFGAAPADLYFKIAVDAVAIVLLISFGTRLKIRSFKRTAQTLPN